MTDKLKPCPFCGSTRVREENSPAVGMIWIECFDCKSNGPYANVLSGAWVDAWNKRPSQWLPIEDAPKNGTIILLWRQSWSHCRMARWTNVYVGGPKFWVSSTKITAKPTHFQFLPSPPEVSP